MNLLLEHYAAQLPTWPREGRHILAQFDASSVVVYQAFRPEIGRFAAKHGFFGGAFSLSRMSWVKPNFLWMMYRSDWGTKPDQEVTLAVRIRRDAFDTLLCDAVHSAFVQGVYESPLEWQRGVARSSVRLQWDPDHNPTGHPVERRALQLGLRGDVLARYAREWIVSIEDISPFVEQQRAALAAGGAKTLMTPLESVYPVADRAVAHRLGIADRNAEDRQGKSQC